MQQNRTNKRYEEMLYVSWFARAWCVINDDHKMAVLSRRLAVLALENPFGFPLSCVFVLSDLVILQMPALHIFKGVNTTL